MIDGNHQSSIVAVQEPDMSTPPAPPSVPVRASLRELAGYFTRLGFVAFGGPAAHIAMMQDDLVERRRWVDRQYFLDMLAATQLVPGPNSTEMVIHIGHLHQGLRGLAVAGFCFITPAFLMVLGLSVAYVAAGTLPQVGALFYGIQPVIVAIVLVAVIKLARTACRTPAMALLAVAAALIALSGLLGTVWIILLGGVVGLLIYGARVRALSATLLPILLVVLPQNVIAAASTPTLTGLFAFFLTVGATAMGSGYVIASYLSNGLVQRLGWLTPTQLVDAIAVGQMTPGPVFTTAAFAGYVIMAGPEQEIAAGVAGALVSTVAIFLPAFIIVWLMAPWVARMRTSLPLGAFFDGVSAAVVGAIAATTVALFRTAVINLTAPVLSIPLGGFTIDIPALLLFVGCTLLLLRPRAPNSTWLVGSGATLGLLLQWGAGAF
jgi:chromate transporter